jgi:hypothetical protein
MTIPELETTLLYHVTPNERKRMKWYKKHDKVKFIQEIWLLWKKYSEVGNDRTV